MSVTLRQVAQHSGTSVPAVSKVLNTKNHGYAPTTAKRILESAKQLGYRPNWRAQSLARKRSQVIALVFGRNEEYLLQSSLITQLIECLGEVDHDLMLLHSKGPLDDWAHKLQDGRVDGCFMVHPVPLGMDEFVSEHRIPSVLLNLKSGVDVPQISFDDVTGAIDATNHLIELGHRKIEYFWTPKAHGYHYSVDQRLEGYQKAMKQAGLDPSINQQHEKQWVDEFAKMSLVDRPTALVVYNNHDAMLVMQQLLRYGFKIPEQISIISFNDDPICKMLMPPLTTVAPHVDEMAQMAVSMLLNQIDQKSNTPVQMNAVISEHLIIRGSTTKLMLK